MKYISQNWSNQGYRQPHHTSKCMTCRTWTWDLSCETKICISTACTLYAISLDSNVRGCEHSEHVLQALAKESAEY